MTSSNEICRLCFSYNKNDSFDLINESILEILNVFGINLYLDKSSRHVMCSCCSGKLSAAFAFKSTCICTDTVIISYGGSQETSQFDLKDVCLKEKDNKESGISTENEVCRLCLQLTGNEFVPVQEMEMNTFHKFLPEINLNIIRNPVVCKCCFDSFAIHSRFLMNCLGVQEKIKSSHCQKTGNQDQLSLENFVKMEEVHIKSENEFSNDSNTDFDKFKVEIEKTNLIRIKSEENGQDDHGSFSDNLPVFEIHPVKLLESNQIRENKNINKCETEQNGDLKNNTTQDLPHGQIFQCEFLQNKTNFRYNLKRHHSVHNCHPKRQTHRCDHCGYETKRLSNLKIHSLRHKDPCEVQMYKCDTCDYETKNKAHLGRHQLIHKDPSEVQMYKCDLCDYESRFLNTVKKHSLVHKDASQLQMYNCDLCGHKSKRKSDFELHQLVHKDLSEVQKHKCEECEYVTKYKNSLKLHQLKHRDPSQVEMHKCDICGYETRIKDYLRKHRLRHQNLMHVQIYKCHSCDYSTRNEDRLATHQVIHEDPSQLNKCDSCNYESKYKSQLERHQLSHKNPSQVQMHKCDNCDFQTKFKNNLTRHVLKHKDQT